MWDPWAGEKGHELREECQRGVICGAPVVSGSPARQPADWTSGTWRRGTGAPDVLSFGFGTNTEVGGKAPHV